MKKILMICIILLASLRAHATTMCVANNSLAIVLDPQVDGTSYSYNADLYEWYAVFPYGTVAGIATCVGTSGGAPTDTLIDDETGDFVTGGERTGNYCWCRMTHPVKSRWVYRYTASAVDNCGSTCANSCGFNVRNDVSFRRPMFGSVGD